MNIDWKLLLGFVSPVAALITALGLAIWGPPAWRAVKAQLDAKDGELRAKDEQIRLLERLSSADLLKDVEARRALETNVREGLLAQLAEVRASKELGEADKQAQINELEDRAGNLEQLVIDLDQAAEEWRQKYNQLQNTALQAAVIVSPGRATLTVTGNPPRVVVAPRSVTVIDDKNVESS